MTKNNTRIQITKLSFSSGTKIDASVDFKSGLNIIYGASDTGKSFLARALDFMLGGGEDLKDIPERVGYDNVSLDLLTSSKDSIHLERSIAGGDFHFKKNDDAKTILGAKHDSKSDNNLSRQLLSLIGLSKSEILTAKEEGKKRSLSFRDLINHLIIHEEDITKSNSPVRSGQHIFATQEKSVFKLLLTGIDDASFVGSKKAKKEALNFELINQLINEYKSELEVEEKSSIDIKDQLEKLNISIEKQNKAVDAVQEDLESSVRDRNELDQKRNSALSRLDELKGLMERFNLLAQHYDNDLKRLEAIKESGVLLTFLDYQDCPLCGAIPDNQKHESSCDGDIKSVIDAASAEILKILHLKKDLGKTVTELSEEKKSLVDAIKKFDTELEVIQKNITRKLAPELANNQNKFSELVKKHYQASKTKDILEKIASLEEKKKQLKGQGKTSSTTSEEISALSKSVLGNFTKKVENILQAWGFPDVDRVYFDEAKMDIVISDKPRGSHGKGLRAITHAAFTVGLLEYCIEQNLPHPGFILLDSPLLAYKEPEPGDNHIEQTDLKDKFYRYLDSIKNDNIQIIITENIAPPANLKNSNITYFTGNNEIGRSGLFPLAMLENK